MPDDFICKYKGRGADNVYKFKCKDYVFIKERNCLQVVGDFYSSRENNILDVSKLYSEEDKQIAITKWLVKCGHDSVLECVALFRVSSHEILCNRILQESYCDNNAKKMLRFFLRSCVELDVEENKIFLDEWLNANFSKEKYEKWKICKADTDELLDYYLIPDGDEK